MTPSPSIKLSIILPSSDIHTSTLSPEELPGVPVACVSGVVNVSVKVRGVEASVVPRVQVEAVVGGVHCLLAPAQLHILTEVATNLQRGKGEPSTTVHVLYITLYSHK